MVDREKVIKGLECQYKPRMTCYGCDYFIARDKLCNKNKIFREAVDLLKAQEPGWISVKDRLPEEKQSAITLDFEYVLCATTFGDVRPYK